MRLIKSLWFYYISIVIVFSPHLCSAMQNDLQTLYTQYSQTNLLSDRYFEIKDFSIKEEALSVNFKEGVFFLTEVISEGYRGCVFIGEGSFSVEVPEVWEQVVTNRLKADSYPLTECKFKVAFFLMSPEYLNMHDFFSSEEVLLCEPDEVVIVNDESEKIKAALIEKAENILYSRVGPSDQTRLPVISFLKNHYNKTPKLKPILFDFKTGDHGWLSYEHLCEKHENIRVSIAEDNRFNRQDYWNINVLASFNDESMKKPVNRFAINQNNTRMMVSLPPDNAIASSHNLIITPESEGIRLIVLDFYSEDVGEGDVSITGISSGSKENLQYLFRKKYGDIIIDTGSFLSVDEEEAINIEYIVDFLISLGTYCPCYTRCCEEWPLGRYGNLSFYPDPGDLYGLVNSTLLPVKYPDIGSSYMLDITFKLPEKEIDRLTPLTFGVTDIVENDELRVAKLYANHDSYFLPLIMGKYFTSEAEYTIGDLVLNVKVQTLPKQKGNAERVFDVVHLLLNWDKGRNIWGEKPLGSDLTVAEGAFITRHDNDLCVNESMIVSKSKSKKTLIAPGECFLSDPLIQIYDAWFQIEAAEEFWWIRTSEGSRLERITSILENMIISSIVESRLSAENKNDKWLITAISGYIYSKFIEDHHQENYVSTLGKWKQMYSNIKYKNDLPLGLANSIIDENDTLFFTKGTMVLNMIETAVGEEIMIDTLREFFIKYQDKQFKYQSFFDILYEKINQSILKIKRTGNKKSSLTIAKLETFRNMKEEFLKDWIMRSGNTELKISKEIIQNGKRHGLLLRINQDEEDFKHMIVPVSIYKTKRKKVTLYVLLDKPNKVFEAQFSWKPKKIVIDEDNTLPAKINKVGWEE